MTKNDDSDNKEIQDARVFWIELSRTIVRESLSTTEDTAQKVITLVGILIGLYSGAITISTLRSQNLTLWLMLLLLSPIIFWLLSMVASLGVFWPNKYGVNIQSATGAKDVIEILLRKKHNRLRISFVFLFTGIIMLTFALGMYLMF